MSSKPKKRDILMQEEVIHCSEKVLYQAGLPYLFVMSYGWAIVAFYVRHENPLRIRVAHANFFRQANTDYGTLTEGAPDNCEWMYIGNSVLTEPHILRADEYFGKVPRGRIKL